MEENWTPIKVLSQNDIVENWFETTDGKRLALPIYYPLIVDLDNMKYCQPISDEQAINSLYSLVKMGQLTLKHIYGANYRMDFGYIKTMSPIRIQKIQEYFKEKCGVNVTETAILHNFTSWQCDYKSGYRDDENGYHLFTPCGCNPFSLTLSKLPKEMNIDWQITYQA